MLPLHATMYCVALASKAIRQPSMPKSEFGLMKDQYKAGLEGMLAEELVRIKLLAQEAQKRKLDQEPKTRRQLG